MYPTESVYSKQPHTDEAVAIVREQGSSRLAYLAGDIEAGYWRTNAADLGDLVMNAIRWLVRDTNPIQVEGEGLIEVYGWETEPGYALHLVNFTNPNFRGGAARRVYGVGPQTVRMVLRDSKPVRNAHLLRSGQLLDIRQSGRVAEFTIPHLAEYEVAVFER
jgi:hypothetical protein